MDECVDWIDAVLRSERDLNSSSSIGAGVQEGSKQVEENSDGQTQVKRNGGVLVHCQAGMSRSATIVAAYLMKTLKLSVDEALDMIRAVRPVIE
jgi:dual specificity phosphatase 12